MKCPCCGEESDRDFIIVHNKLYKRDGTILHTRPAELALLQKLLVRPVGVGHLSPNERRVMHVHISRLREFLRLNNLPYSITSNGVYTLKVHRS